MASTTTSVTDAELGLELLGPVGEGGVGRLALRSSAGVDEGRHDPGVARGHECVLRATA